MRTFSLALLFGFVFGVTALAHDGVNDAWFESLQSPATGIRCCGGDDCLPTEAELREGRWWSRTPDGVWHEEPANIVIHDRGNPVGQPILCAVPNGVDGGFTVLCFVPGALI